jgi:hypothetical protein
MSKAYSLKPMVLLFIVLLFASGNTASAQAWIIDGGKALPIADPAGLRSQIGAVASAFGQATNLTVVDTLTVAGVVDSTAVTISGADAGDYVGVYEYAGTDAYFGSYFTNSEGKFLTSDVDYYLNGEWILGDFLGGVVFGSVGSTWYNMSWDDMDITMTGTPSYGVQRGDLAVAGDVNIEGDISAGEFSGSGFMGLERIPGTSGIFDYTDISGSTMFAYVQSDSDELHAVTQGSLLNVNSLNSGYVEMNAGTGLPNYNSVLNVFSAGGPIYVKNSHELFASLVAQWGTLTITNSSRLSGVFVARAFND